MHRPASRTTEGRTDEWTTTIHRVVSDWAQDYKQEADAARGRAPVERARIAAPTYAKAVYMEEHKVRLYELLDLKDKSRMSPTFLAYERFAALCAEAAPRSPQNYVTMCKQAAEAHFALAILNLFDPNKVHAVTNATTELTKASALYLRARNQLTITYRESEIEKLPETDIASKIVKLASLMPEAQMPEAQSG